MALKYKTSEEMTAGNGSNWKFGVNQKVFMKKIEYKPEEQKEKKDGSGTYTLNERVVAYYGHEEDTEETQWKSITIFAPDTNEIKLYGGKVVAKGMQEFDEEFEKRLDTAVRAMLDIVECYVNKDIVYKSFEAANLSTFKDVVDYMFKHLHNVNFKTIPVDLFMQWSSNVSSKGSNYLEIPSPGRMGLWVCMHQPGEWEEDIVKERHYRLLKKENGVLTNITHPIKRGNFKQWWDKHGEKIEFKEAVTAPSETASSSTSSPDIDWNL